MHHPRHSSTFQYTQHSIMPSKIHRWQAVCLFQRSEAMLLSDVLFSRLMSGVLFSLGLEGRVVGGAVNDSLDAHCMTHCLCVCVCVCVCALSCFFAVICVSLIPVYGNGPFSGLRLT